MYDWKSKETRYDAVENQLNEFNQEGYEIYNVIKTMLEGDCSFFLVIARKPIELTIKDKGIKNI